MKKRTVKTKSKNKPRKEKGAEIQVIFFPKNPKNPKL